MRAVWDKSAGVNLTQGAPDPGQTGQAGCALSFVPRLPSLPEAEARDMHLPQAAPTPL